METIVRPLSGREGRATLTPLSQREHQVAIQVFAGRANREIAAALAISVKTVESHLSSAFVKLGVRSRSQLAVYVARSRI